MNNNISVEQMSRTDILDSNSILRQNNMDLIVRLMEIESVNPKIRQDQIAKELGCSNSTLQGYTQDMNMLSPYRIPPICDIRS